MPREEIGTSLAGSKTSPRKQFRMGTYQIPAVVDK
jgi:hypothetical protein